MDSNYRVDIWMASDLPGGYLGDRLVINGLDVGVAKRLVKSLNMEFADMKVPVKFWID